MIALLKKSGVALLVLALALVAQIPHAAHVFDRAPYIGQADPPSSAWYALLLAFAYAIALESATLMFVVHGHRRASYGFALASFAVNLSYYAMHGVALWAFSAFPAWLLSALLPTAIASYSHILTGADDVGVGWPQWALQMVGKERPPAPDMAAEDASEAQPDATPDATPAPATQLDDYDQRIVNAIRNGAYTQTAIANATSIASTTLKRKQGDKLTGRLPKLCAAGVIHNSSGADGSEYRLVE